MGSSSVFRGRSSVIQEPLSLNKEPLRNIAQCIYERANYGNIIPPIKQTVHIRVCEEAEIRRVDTAGSAQSVNPDPRHA